MKIFGALRRRLGVEDGVGGIHLVGVVGLAVFERSLFADPVDVFGGAGHSLQPAPEVGRDKVRIGPENGAGKTAGEDLDGIEDESWANFY